VNIRNLTNGLEYRGEVEARRQTYFVFEGKSHYFVMSLSRSKRHAGNFNIVDAAAVEYVARKFAGRKKVTSTKVAAASPKPRGVANSLEALNVLYVLIATNRAKIDTRFHDKQLFFNVGRAFTA
jgi:hypothetical protein